jgi:hypothetical protein
VVVDDMSRDNSVDLISRFLDPSGVWAGTRVCVCLTVSVSVSVSMSV